MACQTDSLRSHATAVAAAAVARVSLIRDKNRVCSTSVEIRRSRDETKSHTIIRFPLVCKGVDGAKKAARIVPGGLPG